MFLGYRLKLLRKNKAMSQFDLGKKLGVSKVSISGYEKGTRKPSIEIFTEILKIFDVSADYLLGRDLNVVCEDDNTNFKLCAADINIINILHKKTVLYNKIASNPDRFFESIIKK